MARSANIVGLSAFFHDAACCLLLDGRLVAAAEEERFTRLKHDPSLPRNAFRFCLDEAGLSVGEIDRIAYYEDPTRKLERQLWYDLPDVPPRRPESLLRLDAARPVREIRRVLGYQGPIEIVGHHLSHAASAYYYSGFPDAAVLTVDGVGEWTTMSYGRGDGDALDLFEEVHFPHSIGLLYAAITSYLGFEVFDGEYKVMGLAPYGRPRYRAEVRQLFEVPSPGQIVLHLRYFDFRGPRMYTDELCALFGRPPRPPESDLDEFTADVAQSLQTVLEELLLEKVAYLHERVPSRHLCLAGGVALNCVANSRILRDGPFEELFVQPAASDAGGCLGAAAVAHLRFTGQSPVRERLAHVAWGPSFAPDAIAPLVPPGASDHRGRERALYDDVAARLEKGQVIGWFQGRMELGPRALGCRSILADPRRPEMRDRINALVKQREGFRPFAPAVLAARADRHFAIDHPSPFMLETFRVTSALDLPAVTHVDRSARVQTVDPAENPRFAALLEAFEARTGCPILLNTSFNVRGEPIVCRPLDALLCFVRSDIDALALGDFVIDRADVPAEWVRWIRSQPASVRQAVNHDVYTFL